MTLYAYYLRSVKTICYVLYSGVELLVQKVTPRSEEIRTKEHATVICAHITAVTAPVKGKLHSFVCFSLLIDGSICRVYCIL